MGQRLLAIAVGVTAGVVAAPLPVWAQAYPATEYDVVDQARGQVSGDLLWRTGAVVVQGSVADNGSGAIAVFDFYQGGLVLGRRTRAAADAAFTFAYPAPSGSVTSVAVRLCDAAGACGVKQFYAPPPR